MAKAKKGNKGKSGGGRPAEMLLVASKVKAMIRDAGYNTAGDALDGLNEVVAQCIRQACERVEGNKRKTIRAYDF
jgi:hypothetical protein